MNDLGRNQMGGDPSRVVIGKDGTHDGFRRGGGGGPTAKVCRNPEQERDDDVADLIKCSGRHCRSCTAGLIADCVAVCCCPCAVVNILALAFVKVPWKIGRKCLRRVLRKDSKRAAGRRIMEENKKKIISDSCAWEENDGALEIVVSSSVFDDEEEDGIKESWERVWLELYQVGHLGFGRVSFTGISSSSSSHAKTI